MAELGYRADTNDTQENSFDPVPAGDYISVIESSDYTPNKNNDGKILKLVWQVVDGPFKDRKIFENLNLENKSQQAMQISRRALNAIAVATGVVEIQDTAQLHGIPVLLEVGIKEDDYGKKNTIKKHKPVGGDQQQQQAAAPAGGGFQQENNAATQQPAQPWLKR